MILPVRKYEIFFGAATDLPKTAAVTNTPEPNKDLRNQTSSAGFEKVYTKEEKPSYKNKMNGLFAAGYENPGGIIIHFTVKNDNL